MPLDIEISQDKRSTISLANESSASLNKYEKVVKLSLGELWVDLSIRILDYSKYVCQLKNKHIRLFHSLSYLLLQPLIVPFNRFYHPTHLLQVHPFRLPHSQALLSKQVEHLLNLPKPLSSPEPQKYTKISLSPPAIDKFRLYAPIIVKR